MILFETPDGRTVADTDGMVAVVPARRWDVRKLGRVEGAYGDVACLDGRTRTLYDARAVECILADADRDILVTAAQAAEWWGIRAGTIRQWKSTGRVASFECNERGHPLYSAEELLQRAGLSRRVDNPINRV